MNPGKNGSSGPKTLAGKARSSRNSRKHGFFEKELHLSEEERLQYEQLSDGLAHDLQPTTAVLQLLFDDVLACAWRMKRALRCEQLQILEHWATDDKNSTKSRVPATTPVGSLYSSVMLGLREKLKLLDELESRFRAYPIVSEYPEMQKQIVAAFGAEFCKTLLEWEPAEPWQLNTAILAAERNKVFDTNLPPPPNPEAKRRIIKEDENARIQMMTKLVELQRQHVLSAAQHVRDAHGGIDHQAQRLDLFLRYQTKARHDFYHALREYWNLKETEKGAR